ncbi:hypothetical protein [Sinomicrobium weinanense]|uniref:Uncharacterized protein n=1 Tax=Sinomicrobium weinanense TaxID=2842200 RepID=A0A926Q364_9FLAO|nr:hypothetical protein [Sinomicrobium weinanense]MBC9797302.1 hypothetical protein [Sinomicrobium weinanense]MBU3122771.1 hypothetical protein [Sinomicrobium weinanense]
MKTSWLETKQLEDRIFRKDTGADALMMDVKLYLSEDLRQKLAAQKDAYGYIQAYGRKKLKTEIASVHHKLFHEEKHNNFRKRIRKIFSANNKI